MGTRGFLNFRQDDKDKMTYNHYDSYPSGVGTGILKELKEVTDWGKVIGNIQGVKLIQDEDKKPTASEIKKYSDHTNTSVGGTMDNTTVETYYQLLRNIQGTIKPYLNGDVNIMIDNSGFIYNSLFCEWGYTVNFDTMKLEVWEGYQRESTKGNRYGEVDNGDGYYPCKLIKEYDLKNLPTEEKFVEDLEPEEEDE